MTDVKTVEVIASVVQNIWETTLGIKVRRAPAGTAAPEGAKISSCVNITGNWEGTVTCTFTEALSKRVAGTMFDLAAAETEPADVADAIGEIANQTAGGFKMTLIDGCMLSLPTITTGDFSMSHPGTTEIAHLIFIAEGDDQPLAVQVVIKAD